MARIRKLQSSFTTGELTPKLQGRVDITKYSSGLKQLLNFIVSPFGAVTRRPGTRYVSESKGSAVYSRLIDFEYSNTQTYTLEFFAGGIRFFTQQGQLLSSASITNGTFDSNITGWTSRSTGTGAISHSSGKLQLTGSVGNDARAYQVVTTTGVGNHTITLDVGTASINYRIGNSIGASDLASGTLTTGTGKTIVFTRATSASTWIEFESTTTSTVDNVTITNPPYEINTSFSSDEIDHLRFAQSYDTLYIVHANHPPSKLVRYASADWRLSTIEFDEPPYEEINSTDITLTPSGTSGTVTVTASEALFASTDVGRAIRFKAGPDRSDVVVLTGTGSQIYFDIPFYPSQEGDIEVNSIAVNGSKTSLVYTSGIPSSGEYSIIGQQVLVGVAPTVSEQIEILPANAGSGEWGWMEIVTYVSSTEVTCLVKRELAGANSSEEWRLGSWSETTGYPKLVVFHEQRLWFANIETRPQYFWASQTGNYSNFQPDNALFSGQIDNDTSFSFEIASEFAQSIMWMVSKGSLLVGTTNSVFAVKGGTGGVSTSNISVQKQFDVPCEDTEPSLTSNEILFIERGGKRIWSTFYTFDLDGYTPIELTLLADHIGGQSKFTSITWQPSLRCLWALRENGTIASCTYIRAQEVTGWAIHELGGTNPSVVSIVNLNGETFSEIWMVIQRTINGNTERYIEFITNVFEYIDKENAVFSDSSLEYDGVSTSVITGLDHLEGESVSILSNGTATANKIVTGGQITLDKSTTRAIIGLGYVSRLETLSIEGGSVIGTAQSSISRVVSVAIRFFETIGCQVGFRDDILEQIVFRTASTPLSQSPSLYSGWKEIDLRGGYDNEYGCYIEQNQPLPLTILSLVFNATVSDKT